MGIVEIVGVISGFLSLIGIIYMLGYWKGQVDSKLRDIQQILRAYPLAELSLMTKTLWDIYVVDALSSRPDLAEQHSAFNLKKEGHELIPAHLKEILDNISPNPESRNAIASGWLVVKRLGIDTIREMAKQQKLSVQEAIAILSCYLDERAG
ncbi:hypothetical protein ES703_101008 [subsurface metagenome]